MQNDFTKWDLTDIYTSINDPKITLDINLIKTAARDFNRKYHGQIKILSSEKLQEMIEEYETIVEKIGVLLSFSHAQHSLRQNGEENKRFLTQIEEEVSGISELLTFFILELGRLPRKVPGKIQKYQHYLEKILAHAPHVLTEDQEAIMIRKSLTSRSAFVKLYDYIQSERKYKWEGKIITEAELESYLLDSDRSKRKKAFYLLNRRRLKDKGQIVFIYNTILQDKKIDDQTRKYANPWDAKLESEEIPFEVLQAMTEGVRESYVNTSQRYNILKAKMLNLRKLRIYDRMAPVAVSNFEVGYAKSRAWVLEALLKFDQEFYDLARKMFTNPWIDVYPNDGKYSGGYCDGVGPGKHPLILMNYTGKLIDTKTLIHEMGHAIHFMLSYPRGTLNYEVPLALAETASKFGEILLDDYLQDKLSTKERLYLATKQIEAALSSLQSATLIHRFEIKAHVKYGRSGELKSSEFADIFKSLTEEQLGDTVLYEKNIERGMGWMDIPHIFHEPFYYYSYAFGQSVVFSLYQLYLKDKQSFVPKYKRLLSAGNTETPVELLKQCGIDITKKDFWQMGIDFLVSYIDKTEKLYEEVKLLA